MYVESETSICPQCDLPVIPFAELEESEDAKQLDGEEAVDPLDEHLSLQFMGRGRGLLILLGIAGIAAFFGPWLQQTAPELRTWSGYQFARRLGWLWAAGIAWPIMITLTVTRRTIRQMRGARFAIGMLAAIVVTTVAARLVISPTVSPYVPLRFEYGWGLYAAGVLGLVALFAAWRFGGSIIDLNTTQHMRRDDETLH